MKGKNIDLQCLKGHGVLWYYSSTLDSSKVITAGIGLNISIPTLPKERSGIYYCHGYNKEKTRSYISYIKVIVYSECYQCGCHWCVLIGTVRALPRTQALS